MKKYLMIFILEFIFVLSSCDKNNNGQELEFNDIDISVKSDFTDTNLTINLNASDLEDGDNYYNYFHCQKSLNELKDTLNKNEYYVENGDIIRFFKDDSYFFLRTVEECNGYNKYCLSSESITSRHEGFVCHLPFPSEYFPLIHEETDFSNLDINYLKDYYSRLNYDFLEINDEKILYKNITNPIGEEYYNIEFNFSSKTIKFNN